MLKSSQCSAAMEAVNHYNTVAKGYDAYIVNSNTPEHLERHVDNHLSQLNLEEWWNGGAKGTKIVDLGAGTGNFTLALARRVAPHHRVLCVEPSENMLQKVLKFPELEPMLLDAVAFSKVDPSEISYSHVVMKEVIHHLPFSDLASLFQGFYQQMQPGGYICVGTRPQKPQILMFEEAYKVWKKGSHCPMDIARTMESAGFVVEMTEVPHKFLMMLDDWCNAVMNRCWSTFGNFTDEELRQGVEEMRNTCGNTKELEANDVFIYITGHKPSNGAKGLNELPLQNIERIVQQKFLGPFRVFPKDSTLPDWREMVKPDPNLESNASEMCSQTGYKTAKSHPFLLRLVNHPDILHPVSSALGCHNIVCSVLSISTGITEQPTSGDSQQDFSQLRQKEAVAVHVALAHAKPLKSNLEPLFTGFTSKEKEDGPLGGPYNGHMPINLAPGEAFLHFIPEGSCYKSSRSNSQGLITICYMPAHIASDLSLCGAFTVVRGRKTI